MLFRSTACVSVLLFEALCECKLILGQRDSYNRECVINGDKFKIPNDSSTAYYGTEHCSIPNYWFYCDGCFENYTELWISRMFRKVKCGEICEKVNRKTGNCSNEGKCKYRPGPEKVSSDLKDMVIECKKALKKALVGPGNITVQLPRSK